jgi:hypothetical protein
MLGLLPREIFHYLRLGCNRVPEISLQAGPYSRFPQSFVSFHKFNFFLHGVLLLSGFPVDGNRRIRADYSTILTTGALIFVFQIGIVQSIGIGVFFIHGKAIKGTLPYA